MEAPIIAIMDGDKLSKVLVRTPTGDKDIGEALARLLHHCRSSPWQEGEERKPMTTAAWIQSQDQRLADAEADALRLHNEKMQFFDRSVAAEAAVARARAEAFEEAAKIADDFGWILPMYEDRAVNVAVDDSACSVSEQIATAIRAAQGGGNAD